MGGAGLEPARHKDTGSRSIRPLRHVAFTTGTIEASAIDRRVYHFRHPPRFSISCGPRRTNVYGVVSFSEVTEDFTTYEPRRYGTQGVSRAQVASCNQGRSAGGLLNSHLRVQGVPYLRFKSLTGCCDQLGYLRGIASITTRRSAGSLRFGFSYRHAPLGYTMICFMGLSSTRCTCGLLLSAYGAST